MSNNMPRQSREKSGTGIYQMIIRTVPLIVRKGDDGNPESDSYGDRYLSHGSRQTQAVSVPTAKKNAFFYVLMNYSGKKKSDCLVAWIILRNFAAKL